MLLATHNSMSYLPPRRWYMRPFRFIVRCQNKTIEEQFALGARMFDIRLRWSEKAIDFVFAHGHVAFRGPRPADIFATLNALAEEAGEPVYIRMVLEEPSRHTLLAPDFYASMYCEQCAQWCHRFPLLRFFGFHRRYDWKKLYSRYDEPGITLYQAVSSMTGSILDDWWPWLYARTHNRDNLAQGTTADALMIDFIGTPNPKSK